jgi:hypothetical protein
LSDKGKLTLSICINSSKLNGYLRATLAEKSYSNWTLSGFLVASVSLASSLISSAVVLVLSAVAMDPVSLSTVAVAVSNLAF